MQRMRVFLTRPGVPPMTSSFFSSSFVIPRSDPVQTEFDEFDNTGSSVHCRGDTIARTAAVLWKTCTTMVSNGRDFDDSMRRMHHCASQRRSFRIWIQPYRCGDLRLVAMCWAFREGSRVESYMEIGYRFIESRSCIDNSLGKKQSSFINTGYYFLKFCIPIAVHLTNIVYQNLNNW